MREYRIAAIPGDGIGTEVVSAGLRVIEALARRAGDFKITATRFPWGSEYYRQSGRMMPDDGLSELKTFDAILFGAVGDPEIPDDVTLWGLRLKICQGFDQYANVRPTRILPGSHEPARQPQPGRPRLGHRAREQRGRVCRRRRPHPPRHAGGGRHRGRDLHPAWGGTDHALRLRAGARPPAAARHRRHQVQRPAPRHGSVGRGRCRGRRKLPRRRPTTRCWSMR